MPVYVFPAAGSEALPAGCKALPADHETLFATVLTLGLPGPLKGPGPLTQGCYNLVAALGVDSTVEGASICLLLCNAFAIWPARVD